MSFFALESFKKLPKICYFSLFFKFLIILKKLYSKWILEDHRGLVDLLQDLKSFRPPADLLLELLNPLKPRLYSISSSSLVHTNRIHITAAILNYKTNSGLYS